MCVCSLIFNKIPDFDAISGLKFNGHLSNSLLKLNYDISQEVVIISNISNRLTINLSHGLLFKNGSMLTAHFKDLPKIKNKFGA